MHPIEVARTYACLGQHEQHPWKPMPWPGIQNKVLFCDPIMGATIELAKIDKGARFPVHYHTTVQTLFLISGRIKAEDRVIEPGTFDVIPAGQRHGGYVGEEDSIQFKFFSSLPVYLVEDGTILVYRKDGSIIDCGQTEFTRNLTVENIIAA